MDTLTRAGCEDKEEILRLYRLCGRLGHENHTSDWDEEYPDEETLEAHLSGGQLFVLRDDARIYAAVSILETDDLDEEDVGWTPGKSFVLCRLCVAPDLQGRGLGMRVVGLACARMAKLGYRFVHLMTPTVNLAAQAMYRRAGMRDMGVRFMYGIDFVLYEKHIV